MDLVHAGSAEPVKFCRDCKYHEQWEYARWADDRWRCNRQQRVSDDPVEYDLVTGEAKRPVIDNCHANRRDPSRCGPDGSWWEPIDGS